MTSTLIQKMNTLLHLRGNDNGSADTAWDVSKVPDLTGKVYIVTGGSKGIGYGIVSALVSRNPKKVYFLSKDEEPAREKLEALKDPNREGKEEKKETQEQHEERAGEGAPAARKRGEKPEGDEKVEWVKCNLADLKEVDRVSLELKEKLSRDGGRLDGFVANAGIGVGKYQMTTDGIEAHFQINHLSQMHMILTLLPVLRDTSSKYKSDVRIVITTSENHRLASSSTKFASLDEINRDVGASELYNRSKLAQVCFMPALIRRLEKDQLPSSNCPIVHKSAIIVNAVHPGVVLTDQQQQMEDAWGLAGKAITTAIKPISKDPIEEGCLSPLYALTSPEIISKNGGIYGQYITPPNKVSAQSSLSQDVGLQENLWSLSVGLLKEKLGKV